MTAPAAAVPLESADQSLLSGDDAVVVRHYAEALVDAAVAEDRAEVALEDLEAIDREVLRQYPKFRQILGTSQVSGIDKDRILVDVFGSRVSSVVLRFLRVLNRHGRLGLLSSLPREARRIWDRRHKRVPVFVRTAVPLDQGQEQALRERVAGMIAATPIMQITTDSSLIGGLIVQVGDQVCDASVRNRLEKLRQSLIEGKTHEIQSRRDQFSNPA
jgi:F-type H+-transporting ATPase subunit delta